MCQRACWLVPENSLTKSPNDATSMVRERLCIALPDCTEYALITPLARRAYFFNATSSYDALWKIHPIIATIPLFASLLASLFVVCRANALC